MNRGNVGAAFSGGAAALVDISVSEVVSVLRWTFKRFDTTDLSITVRRVDR